MVKVINLITREEWKFLTAREASVYTGVDVASISLIMNKTPIKRKDGFGFRTKAKGFTFRKIELDDII